MVERSFKEYYKKMLFDRSKMASVNCGVSFFSSKRRKGKISPLDGFKLFLALTNRRGLCIT